MAPVVSRDVGVAVMVAVVTVVMVAAVAVAIPGATPAAGVSSAAEQVNGVGRPGRIGR